jgi:hypothetical protein
MTKKDQDNLARLYVESVVKKSSPLDDVQLSNGETINFGDKNLTLVEDGNSIKLITDGRGVEYQLAKSHPLKFQATLKEDNKPIVTISGASKNEKLGEDIATTNNTYFHVDTPMDEWDILGNSFDQITKRYGGIPMTSAISIIVEYIKDNDIAVDKSLFW